MKYLIILIVLFFTSCSNIQEKVRNSVQSENAKQIRNDYKEIVKLLSLYKTKLDKRNPKNYNVVLDRLLKDDILNNTNKISIRIDKSKVFREYSDFLNYSFNKELAIRNRNDYLVIGLYKMFYNAYKMDLQFKFTAFNYDIDDLQKAYKNLQVIQWKIKHDKDIKNRYLFLTWQNNWQIELEQKLQNTTLDNIVFSQLENIRLDKESLLSPSNNSFEILISKMILHMAHSIKMLNEEPENLSIDAILSVILII